MKNQVDPTLNQAEYVFYTSKIHEISQTSILPILQNNEVIFYLLKKTTARAITNFVDNFSASLVCETILLHNAALQVLTHLNIIHSYFDRLKDPSVLAKVLSVIPDSFFDIEDPDQKLTDVTRWFKEDFLKFIKSELPCDFCDQKCVKQKSSIPPSLSDRLGGASNVEFFKCSNCGAGKRFPRYNYVEPIILSKKGRCGEFVTAFTSILYALGFDVRATHDTTDHTWVEVWSDSKQRYVAVDPCENTIDAPFMYENGWGKKLEYVIAVGEFSVVDVTRKYVLQPDELKNRRVNSGNSLTGSAETDIAKAVAFRNSCFQSKLDNERKTLIERRNQFDLAGIDTKRAEFKAEEQKPRISGSE